eukprot:131931_1
MARAFPSTMRAMVLPKVGARLELRTVPVPRPTSPGEILVKVRSCGICRTDLHVVNGELDDAGKIPIIPGHQIVGTAIECHPSVSSVRVGARVGIPWLGRTCQSCQFCISDAENLCDRPTFTGYQRDGGFAEYCVADENFCFQIPDGYSDLQAAPLLCAGLIGFRAYRMIPAEANRIGFYGFGSAASILIQVVRHFGQSVFAFTRAGNTQSQAFARALGAEWAGGSDEAPPEKLDAAVIFAPIGSLVVSALKAVRKGGVVVCAGIHMSDIPQFPYRLLWGERTLKSVANLTRVDGVDFMELAPKVGIETMVTTYPLERANEALEDLLHGRFDGSAVLLVSGEKQ